jgi:hypothetical protein
VKRKPGWVILALVVGGVFGTVLSYFFKGLFPDGPVRQFFFQSAQIGIPTTVIKLGFFGLTFGLTLEITTFTVLLAILLVWLVGKL